MEIVENASKWLESTAAIQRSRIFNLTVILIVEIRYERHDANFVFRFLSSSVWHFCYNIVSEQRF